MKNGKNMAQYIRCKKRTLVYNMRDEQEGESSTSDENVPLGAKFFTTLVHDCK